MKKQPKTEIISTRVTPEQREIIEEKAYSSYRTPSMYLRDCALDKKIIVVKGVDPYFDYVTPNHPDCYTMTYSDGLINLLGDILSTVPEDFYYQPHYINELNTAEKLRLEKILGRRICNEAFYTYCTREDYEREQGISM